MVTKTKTTQFQDFIRRQLKLRNSYASRMAKELRVSHPTVGRWLNGEDLPKPWVCWRIAALTGEPLLSVLRMAGHLPVDYEGRVRLQLPAFREYLDLKYPGKLNDSVVGMIERELMRG